MELSPGTRLRSTVCETEVIVVKAPGQDVEVGCGGQPMVPTDSDAAGGSIDPAHADGTLMGKRYAYDELGLEVLCTKPGEGSLTIGDRPLPQKEAKPLPSSD